MNFPNLLSLSLLLLKTDARAVICSRKTVCPCDWNHTRKLPCRCDFTFWLFCLCDSIFVFVPVAYWFIYIYILYTVHISCFIILQTKFLFKIYFFYTKPYCLLVLPVASVQWGIYWFGKMVFYRTHSLN